jgi:hypothetical protein
MFAANNLVLNLDNTNIMKFITMNSSHSTLYTGYKEKYTEEIVNTKLPHTLEEPYCANDCYIKGTMLYC